LDRKSTDDYPSVSREVAGRRSDAAPDRDMADKSLINKHLNGEVKWLLTAD
jgi:hypothetical protein